MNEMTKFEKGTLAMNATKELAELGVIKTRDYVHLLENILEETGITLDRNELEVTMNRKGWD